MRVDRSAVGKVWEGKVDRTSRSRIDDDGEGVSGKECDEMRDIIAVMPDRIDDRTARPEKLRGGSKGP